MGTKKPESPQDRTKPPTEADLMKLSRWARVAFAVRCARRVQPLFTKFWRPAPNVHVSGIEMALMNASWAARAPRSDDGGGPSSAAASVAAVNAGRASAAIVANAADAASRSVNPAESVVAASRSAADAVAAVDALDPTGVSTAFVINAVWDDYDALLARTNGELHATYSTLPDGSPVAHTQRGAPLTDDSPVDPDSLGYLWSAKTGPPEWWPSSTKSPRHKAETTAQGRTKPPSEEDLKQLSRWARVAFAVRCAKRVQPLYTLHWREADERHVSSIARAIDLASAAASRPDLSDEIEINAQFAVTAEAADAADARHKTSSAYASRAAARAVRAAARAADGSDAESALAAVSAGNAAWEASAYSEQARAAVIDAIWRDFDMLVAGNVGTLLHTMRPDLLDKDRPWTQATAINPDSLGPLWSPGQEPEWWPKDAEVPPSSVLDPSPQDDPIELRLRVPVGASDEEIKALIKEFAEAASLLHISFGGSGLKLDTVKVYEHARVSQGVLP